MDSFKEKGYFSKFVRFSFLNPVIKSNVGWSALFESFSLLPLNIHREVIEDLF